MREEFFQQILEYSRGIRRISPPLLMRKFKITFEAAVKCCTKIWLLRNQEARQMAKEWLENQ